MKIIKMVKSASKENVLPAIMIKQVLAANPKAAKSDKIQKALDDRVNKLPEYMRYEIDLGKNTLSYKEELESNISHDINLKEHLIDSKVNKFLRDTITPETSAIQLKNLLTVESQAKIERNYDLVNYHLSKGEIHKAQTKLNEIPLNFELSSKQQNKYDKLTQLFEINKDITINNKTWYELDNAQLSTIHNLANDSTSTSGMQARAILSLIENRDYGFPIPAKVNLQQNAYRAKTQNPKFDVTPKKAENYFIIDYILDRKEQIDDVIFTIYDNLGNKMTNKAIVTSQNQLIVECNKWQEGIYWCKKVVNGYTVDQKQVLILRENTNANLINYLDVYPNPTDNYFNIKFSKNEYNNVNIQITDIRGATIKTINPNNSINNLRIDTSNWQSGVYFVSLINNEVIIETIKLIIK